MHMTETIGAWERKAKICLVDAVQDKEIFLQILEKLEKENSVNADVWKSCFPQIEAARVHLSDSIGGVFLCMFVWGYETQHYLPFTSQKFSKDDVEALQEYVEQFIQISIQCCSDGFEVTTFNENNKLLAYAIQATCENEMLQINLQHYQGKQ